jgi:hypothetical protein
MFPKVIEYLEHNGAKLNYEPINNRFIVITSDKKKKYITLDEMIDKETDLKNQTRGRKPIQYRSSNSIDIL